MDYKQELKKVALANYGGSRYLPEILRDFVRMAQISLANGFYKSSTLEEEFSQIGEKYGSTSGFSRMLAIVIKALEVNPDQDFLGDIYMESEMGNKRTGQFFTPYSLSKLNAHLLFDRTKVDSAITSKGYVSIYEPCCGSGSMLIAWWNIMVEAGYGSFDCFFCATDIDQFCYSATYVQLSLLGVCGLVEHGNAMTGQTYEGLYTPAAFMNPKWHI